MTEPRTPARLVRQARDLIEEVNRAMLDGPVPSAPELSETVQALKSLIERLPQAFDQSAATLTGLAANDKIVMDTGEDPAAAAAEAAAGLRAVSANTEQLAKELGTPASVMFHMGGPGNR
ncbi:hypothetical protein [Streptomyces sp. NPDC090080]|uniref:hypothetical protein n=1 Tax=Streptomyces sp. NPDC090080 TaxID=3365939 RepID=UPI00380C9D1C